MSGPEHRFSFANPLYEKLFNRSQQDLLGKSIPEVFPELEGQGVYELYNRVYTTGQDFVAEEFPIFFERHAKGKFDMGFFNFMAHPVRNSSGEVTDIMIHAHEVTEQVLTKKELQDSERRHRELIDSNPSMLALYSGREMIIEIATAAMLEAWGKGEDVVGRALFDVLPEIRDHLITPSLRHSVTSSLRHFFTPSLRHFVML